MSVTYVCIYVCVCMYVYVCILGVTCPVTLPRSLPLLLPYTTVGNPAVLPLSPDPLTPSPQSLPNPLLSVGLTPTQCQ